MAAVVPMMWLVHLTLAFIVLVVGATVGELPPVIGVFWLLLILANIGTGIVLFVRKFISFLSVSP